MPNLSTLAATLAMLGGPAPQQDRTDEIWSHVDNRIAIQQDVWFEDGQFPKAIMLLRMQFHYSPDDSDIVTNLGWMLGNVERYPEMIKLYETFWAAHPNDPDSPLALGQHYSNKKQYLKAIEVLEKSMIRKPVPNTYRLLAKAYERLNNLKDSLRVYKLLAAKYPKDETAKFNVNRVEKKLKDPKK